MRPALRLLAYLSLLLLGRAALAAEPAAPEPMPPADEEKQAAPATQGTPPPAPQPPPAEAAQTVRTRPSESDVVVVPRKAFLKNGRLELAPFSGVTINDPLIRHWIFGGQLNYFLTDVFAVGLEGSYYTREITSRGNLIGAQYYRVPTMNEIKWAASLNFTYIPVYGKFALMNRHIIHWEAMAIGGVGITQTEIIPRNKADAVFSNYNITPNLGIGARVFLNDWLTVWFNLRDYVFPDKFESPNRPAGQSASAAQSAADTKIINNVVFSLGVSFFLPTSFRYRTPR